MPREGPRMVSLDLISLDLREAREACDAVEGLGRRACVLLNNILHDPGFTKPPSWHPYWHQLCDCQCEISRCCVFVWYKPALKTCRVK